MENRNLPITLERMDMENKDEQLLQMFFDANRQDIADDGFSDDVMRQLPAPRTRPFVVWRGLCLTAGLLLFFCCGGVGALRSFAVNFLVDVVTCILSVDVSTFSPMMALLAAFGLCSVAVFVLAQSMPDKTLLGTKRTMQP